ncbi:RNA-binding protein 45 [Latimeria chalumnae]|uniref:RNA binding motif protein 45 n=1 Tax=Latimeria chalumnae TaxID=7897 RepID=H3A3H1_LATCH|nr:PREDICTED: RNA-binding protein 45 [Latimeria chalumnae]|eukprot:XP_006012349.1 PREDICTED: RNA-binding protein 45 [Latimeria chalumnae]
MEEGNNFKPSVDNLDDPPNSRVFLVISKSTPKEVIREKFSPFGEIQDIWVVKDKQTKERKGVAFVKFARSSQACRAMEEMHGRSLSDDTKPIKVFIAQSRASGSHRDVEDEELTRIFVMIPKSYTEDDLREKFKAYGDIEYCSIIKNKNTGESKGLGYVRYLKPSEAALAIENCDRNFRAILAEPKNKALPFSESEYYVGSSGNGGGRQQEHIGQPDPGINMLQFAEFYSFGKNDLRDHENISKCLSVASRVCLTQEQLFNLFDLIPGLEYCEVQRDPYSGYNKGQALVRYNNVASAIYAREKLHGFDYPPGNMLVVTYFDDGSSRSNSVGIMASQLVAAQMMSMVCTSPVGQQIVKTASDYGESSSSYTPRIQSDVVLPPPQKFASTDSRVKERLFLVFNPAPLPLDILEDVFCRFGYLIEVYLVPGRNVGYAKFANRTSANDAITAIHGKVINGVKLKVMLADPPKEESYKRQRTH